MIKMLLFEYNKILGWIMNFEFFLNFFSIVLFTILYRVYFVNKRYKNKVIPIILIISFIILISRYSYSIFLWEFFYNKLCYMLEIEITDYMYHLLKNIFLIIAHLCIIIGVGTLNIYKPKKIFFNNCLFIIELITFTILTFITKKYFYPIMNLFSGNLKIYYNMSCIVIFFLNLLYILILYTIALKIRRYVETKQPKEFLYICPHCGAYASVLQENIKNANKQCYYCKTDRILLNEKPTKNKSKFDNYLFNTYLKNYPQFDEKLYLERIGKEQSK